MPGYHRLRLPQQYRALLDLDASGFAWEWLRRNPGFRAQWGSPGAAARRASAHAATAARRTTRGVTELDQHPLAAKTASWGLSFSPHPDTPATNHPLIGWVPELRGDTVSLVRPLPWARTVPGLRFAPERWGPGVFRLQAPGGAHLLVRRHGSPELALWLADKTAPKLGAPFGLYLHVDHQHGERVRAANRLVGAVSAGRHVRQQRYRNADRQAAMLCVHDLLGDGVPLHEIGALLLDPAPDNWRSSSERSDLRRLADAGARMVTAGYRSLMSRSDRGPAKMEDFSVETARDAN
ncbi:MAG: hypothetical protein JWR59_2326 [Brevundimonas sp.]|nr:hypothetical protein [Brevundimonas sp.]